MIFFLEMVIISGFFCVFVIGRNPNHTKNSKTQQKVCKVSHMQDQHNSVLDSPGTLCLKHIFTSINHYWTYARSQQGWSKCQWRSQTRQWRGWGYRQGAATRRHQIHGPASAWQGHRVVGTQQQAQCWWLHPPARWTHPG